MARPQATRAAMALLLMGACRGAPSQEPPIHLQRNMMTQDKGKAQRGNEFFADGRAMRPPVEGTITTTAPIDNDRYYQGVEGGQPVKEIPVAVTWDLLHRGQDRYNIYCAPCHDRTGSGNGIVVQRAAGTMVKPPSYHEDRLRAASAGELFNVITHGVRTMPSYSYQVPVDDRWAVVAYIRALQRSQRTVLADVPEEMRGNLK
jgi:mono/diheme cytochrome c family protein